MPGQLTNGEKSRRARELITVGRELEREYLSAYIGREADVLIERTDSVSSDGHTDTYVHIIVDEPIAPNSFVRVQITEVKEESDGELSLLSHRCW